MWYYTSSIGLIKAQRIGWILKKILETALGSNRWKDIETRMKTKDGKNDLQQLRIVEEGKRKSTKKKEWRNILNEAMSLEGSSAYTSCPKKSSHKATEIFKQPFFL